MNWDIELDVIDKDPRLYGAVFAGADEAGRGPLAGAVFAAAVVLPFGLVVEGLDDSKKLTQKRREALYPIIAEKALTFAVARAEVWEIEEINIARASLLAMRRAVDLLSPAPACVIIDGISSAGFGVYPGTVKTAVKGDSRSPNIAAASVLAKVARDRYMLEMHERYPCYGFKSNKGYGTREHYEALAKYGECEIHRKSFL